MGVKAVSVQQALQRVADHPDPTSDDWLAAPAHELICRTLFDLANNPGSTPGSLGKANAARSLIFDRMIGRRKPGTHPATRGKRELRFKDLTGGSSE
jgi:hypothetical protein